MALNGLLDIELSVPNPTELFQFWRRRGLLPTTDGVLGTPERPVQLAVAEGTHRHLSALHLSCATEQDLADIAGRIRAMGVEATISGTRLTCTDPIFRHRITIDVTAPHPLTPAQHRAWNHAGAHGRLNDRADAVTEAAPRAPRRVGHIVLGTPHFQRATEFYFDGLGFKVSDQFLQGVATFGRIETDHHNLLIQPSSTSYINHYALEMDDVDAIGKAGQAVLAERPDASVVGVGRHFLGSNMFWYLTDPTGTMFEFFSDIDQIVDDEAWERDHCKRDWMGADGIAPIAVWGPPEPETFLNPADLPAIAAAREALGLGLTRMDLGINGRSAILMASSRGLGRACAESLAREGVHVVVNGRTEADVRSACQELGWTYGITATPVVADASTTEGHDALLAACPEPDIVLLNGEGPPPTAFGDIDAAKWADTLHRTMVSPLLFVQRVIEGMQARKFGRIVAVSSAMVKSPNPLMSMSHGPRLGLTGVLKGLSKSAVAHNVTINTLLPERFDTGRQEQMAQLVMKYWGVTYEQARAEQVASIKAGRLGRPDEFGDTFAFVCSAQAGYLSGQSIQLDGGSYEGLF